MGAGVQEDDGALGGEKVRRSGDQEIRIGQEELFSIDIKAPPG